ncbi:MAG TPA: hypothetical protein VFT32_12940 [Candidatus Eisenbacteria bacterium]|nr:hypothetical protein [Candidatus Eisenbacteria bacterium]
MSGVEGVMERLRRGMREGMNVRTYVLAGLLVVLLIGVYSVDGRGRPPGPRPADSGAPHAVASLPAAAERSAPATPTPPGWGADPFQRAFQP